MRWKSVGLTMVLGGKRLNRRRRVTLPQPTVPRALLEPFISLDYAATFCNIQAVFSPPGMMTPASPSRIPSSRFRHWLTLVIYLSAFSLVAHLDQRYTQHQGSKDPGVRCRCPNQSWQRLEFEAHQWSAPSPKVASLPRLPAVAFLERSNQFRLLPFLSGGTLYSRPPPSFR